MKGLRLAVTAFLALKMTTLVINLARFPVLRPGDDTALPDVSLLVPARDEARQLLVTLPAMLAQGAGEVIVLDDQSGDATAAVARDLIGDRTAARVVEGAVLPEGWKGKPWACHQLAEAATGSVLVFCDADVHLAPGALAAAVAQMRRQRAAVFSVFPRQRTVSLGEHLVVPLIDDVLLCFLPFPLLSLPVPAAATAHGSCLVLERAAYQRLGGFAAVRTQMVEDVALARLTRRAGLRLGLALGGPMVQVRMYTSYEEIVTGLSRGLRSVVGGSGSLLVAGWLWQLTVYTLPWVRVLADRRWALAVGLGVAERALVEVKTTRYAVWQAALTPLVAPAAGPVVARALRRTATWRGRTYG